MMRKVIILISIALFGATLAHPAVAALANRCFPETDQCVGGRFLGYWDSNGGLPVFCALGCVVGTGSNAT